MASPDFSRYVDLTIYDDNAVTSLNDILTQAKGLLPGWIPRAGQIETVLAEAIAYRSSELSNAINRLPNATAEVLLQLFGVTRSNGTKATATLEITFSDSDVVSRSLPAGTEFLYYSAINSVSYTFTLDADFTLSGTKVGTAAVTAKGVGSGYNFSADDQNLVILSNAAYFESATFSVSPSGGRDPETDEQYFNRGMALLASYTSALTTANQIQAYVSATKSYANRVAVYDRRRYRDRDVTGISYTTHDGYALIAAAGVVSDPALAATEVQVASSNLSDLYDSINARVPTGVSVDVMTAELAEVDVEVTCAIKDGYVSTQVRTAIENAIKNYLDPNTWDWSQQFVRRSEMVALVDGVEGVDYVSDVKFNGRALVGEDNIGYYASSGGTAASASLDISSATPSTEIPAGSAYYIVYTGDADNPVVYTFTTTASASADGTGAVSGVSAVAVASGSGYNDTANGGNVDSAGTFTGSTSGTGQAVITSGTSVYGGTDNSVRYTLMPLSSAVSSTLVLRNLGTLVTYGSITVTFL